MVGARWTRGAARRAVWTHTDAPTLPLCHPLSCLRAPLLFGCLLAFLLRMGATPTLDASQEKQMVGIFWNIVIPPIKGTNMVPAGLM